MSRLRGMPLHLKHSLFIHIFNSIYFPSSPTHKHVCECEWVGDNKNSANKLLILEFDKLRWYLALNI